MADEPTKDPRPIQDLLNESKALAEKIQRLQVRAEKLAAEIARSQEMNSAHPLE